MATTRLTFRSRSKVCSYRRSYRGWLVLVCVSVVSLCLYVLPNCTTHSPRHQFEDQMGKSFYRERKCEDTQTITDYGQIYDPVVDQNNITYAYHKAWVGFPDIESVNCQHAVSFPTLDRIYPRHVDRIFPRDVIDAAKDCTAFVDKFGYARYPTVSQEERDFPIAFSILFHKDIDQFHLLLRAIYRPHNVYCLSVDKKSSVEFLHAVRSMSSCLPNVFVSSQLETIVYAGMSRLQADLNCFTDLLKHPVMWKYVINSPGQAFPIRTNLEIVRILKYFNGTNDVESKTGIRRNENRWSMKWDTVINETTGQLGVQMTNLVNDPPPYGLDLIKCSAYSALTRSFVEFVLTNTMAKDLLNWARSVFSPDEIYWATLNYNTVQPAPGGFKGVPQNKEFLTSFSVWELGGLQKDCVTRFVHEVCILSPAMLPLVIQQPQLFANKFYIEEYPAALHCLDQYIYNMSFYGKTRSMDYYRMLGLSHRGGLIPHH